jgi:ribosomal protein S18 acetylase RimI-like enzyme
LELTLPLTRLTPLIRQRQTQMRLRLVEAADLPAVMAIAGSAFHFDRLHLDPHLPGEKADQRYARWVERGFSAGEPVYVYEDVRTAKVRGFVHVREARAQTIDLSLGGVDPAYQRSGIGVLMYQDVLVQCQAQGYRIVTTWTQISNLEIVNLLIRLGFGFHNAVNSLHWFRAGDGGVT